MVVVDTRIKKHRQKTETLLMLFTSPHCRQRYSINMSLHRGDARGEQGELRRVRWGGRGGENGGNGGGGGGEQTHLPLCPRLLLLPHVRLSRVNPSIHYTLPRPLHCDAASIAEQETPQQPATQKEKTGEGGGQGRANQRLQHNSSSVDERRTPERGVFNGGEKRSSAQAHTHTHTLQPPPHLSIPPGFPGGAAVVHYSRAIDT